MKSVANQKSIVRLPKKLIVARFGDAQIFLGLFVIGIEAQRFTELNNGLRDLTLSQVKHAQTIVSDCQFGIRAKRRGIMHFGLFKITFFK